MDKRSWTKYKICESHQKAKNKRTNNYIKNNRERNKETFAWFSNGENTIYFNQTENTIYFKINMAPDFDNFKVQTHELKAAHGQTTNVGEP